MLETFEGIEQGTWFEITNPAVNNANCMCGDLIEFAGLLNGDRTVATFLVDRTKGAVILTSADVTIVEDEEEFEEEEEEDWDEEADTTPVYDSNYLIVRKICNTILWLAVIAAFVFVNRH
jgi:hypothetical protein